MAIKKGQKKKKAVHQAPPRKPSSGNLLSTLLTLAIIGGGVGAWFVNDSERTDALQTSIGGIKARVTRLVNAGRLSDAEAELARLNRGDFKESGLATGLDAPQRLIQNNIAKRRRDAVDAWNAARELELAENYQQALDKYDALWKEYGSKYTTEHQASGKLGVARAKAKKILADHIEKARAAIENKQWDEADAALADAENSAVPALADDPRKFLDNDARAADDQAEAKNREAAQTALQTLKRAAVDGRRREALVAGGNSSFDSGDWKAAREAYEEAQAIREETDTATRISRCDYEALLADGETLATEKKFDSAIASFTRAEAMKVADERATQGRKRAEAAKAAAEYRALLEQGRGQEGKGVFDDAIATFEQAARLARRAENLDDGEAVAGIADCRVRRNHAAESWDAVLEVTGFTEAVKPLVDQALHEKEAQRITKGMIRVPAGSYRVGDDGDLLAAPAFDMDVGEFFIDPREVTNAEYRAFTEATKAKAPAGWNSPEHSAPDQPVVGVSWEEAKAYAKWIGKRLPTEVEWEVAAHGGTTARFPWGKEADPAKVNCAETGKKKPLPSGANEANGLGIFDMLGNVAEWTADYYQPGYTAPYKRLESGNLVVVRGGAYTFPAEDCRPTARWFRLPAHRNLMVGFRCAYSK